MSEEMNVVEETEEEAVEADASVDPVVGESAVQAPQLGVADLNLMANVLEAVSQRGAIRAGEMEAVGTLYNRLITFLVANGARTLNQPSAQQEVEHTHDDGTTHSHVDGDVEHSHEEGEADNA
jgi:hypothetical protein